MIKNITKTQKKELNKVIDQWTKDTFEKWFKDVSGDFVKLFEGEDFKEFSERIRELILDGFENSTPTILSDHYFYCEEAYNRALRYLEDIDEKDTDELLNFDEDKDIFNIEYYGDDDYYLETLNTLFNTKDISKYFKNSYSDIYINITDEDVHINVEDEAKYYDTFKDLLEDIEGNMLYNIDEEMLLMAYFEAFHRDVFNWFKDTTETDKETRETIKQIEAQIPKTLKERAKELSKEIDTQRAELKVFKRITNETIQREQQSINLKLSEAKQIREATK